jgi:hypothetical protein
MQGQEGVTEGEVATTTLTRNDVASILGISVAKVRRMEGKELHPRFVGGRWLFALDEVTKLQHSPSPTTRRPLSDGELAAELFRRFDQGQSLRQIIRECRQSPKIVQALYRDWATPLGGTPEAAVEDEGAVSMRDEQELVRWEDEMKAMVAADEERDLQDRLTRGARRETSIRRG